MPAFELKSELLQLLSRLKTDFQSRMDPAQKRIGLLCLSSPLEIVDAAGAVPLRLMPGSSEAELRGGRFLSSDSCSFCKAVLGSLDRKEVQFDAVLGSTTCDQMRRNLEIIQRDLNVPVFIFNAPRTADNPLSRDFAREELIRLSQDFGRWVGVSITPEKLNAAILRRSTLRTRLSHILGAQHTAPLLTLTGSEFFALMQLYQTTSLEFFEQHVSEIEDLITWRQSPFQNAPLRLALLGSCIGEGDDLIINLIEENGRAAIVYDSICTGRRALREAGAFAAADCAPSLESDPFESLTVLYHDQILCPHRRSNDRLFQVVAQEIPDLKVQGVVYKTLKFCHPWGFEAKRFKDLLGLPFLHLDHDLSDAAVGQMRTRIAAFIEQLTLRGRSS
jgi:benzoyl-CoA reductase/2-hydroxyglutaryl-CoA dehydratase subunit BcrC/BadD/HgdB